MRPILKFSQRLAQLTILLMITGGAISAQQRSEDSPASFNPNAYTLGERLSYNVDFAHFVSVAHVELFVAGRGTFFNRDGIQLRAHVETTGVVNVALYSIDNEYTSFVDPQTGMPFRAQQIVRQAGRTTELSNDFSAAPTGSRQHESIGVYDILSALYRVRAMPLADGASYFITARNEAEDYEAEVKVSGRQLIKTNVGSFNAIVTRVSLKNRHDYNLRVYFSEDERHLPLVITAKQAEGLIRAELVASEIVAPVVKPGPQAAATPITAATPGPTPVAKPQPTPNRGGKGASGSTRIRPLDLPFKVGEQLNYQVFLGNTPESVGSIAFAVKSRGQFFNHDALQMMVTAQTTGPGARIFPVNDQISSYVDPETLLPFRTELSFSEGKWQTTRSYDVDQNRGAVTLNGKQRIEIPVGTHDLLSLLYAIRTFDLSPKKKNAISILAITEPRTLKVTTERRETIEVNGQKIPALVLKLTTDDPQEDKLQIRMWVGDDPRHLPIRITAVTQYGPVRADLTIVPK